MSTVSGWFSTCPACRKPLGPWTLGATALCGGHEEPVKVDIDWPDQQRHFSPTNAQQRARQRRNAKRAKGGTDVRKTCEEKGCTRKAHARGLCGMHYQRMYAHGALPALETDLTPEQIRAEAAAIEAEVKVRYLVAMLWLAGQELGRPA